MSSVLNRSKVWLARAWRIDAPLTVTALLMLGALAACTVGLWLDPRLVLGAPVWLKPAKFAVSIVIYCSTLLWLFSTIPTFVRTRRVVSWTTAAVMLLEMGIIGAQAARGTTSHFNISTPLNAVAFGVMGAGIVVQTVSSIAVAVALFRQRHADHALGWAMRLGMVIAIAGASFGGLMTRPTHEQIADMRAGHPMVSGAHTVGAPDGGAGIPVTGWSRDHGDLRVPHFIGLHALQVLPLLALATRRTRATETRRVRLVWATAGGYAAFVGLALWQALRGQPMFALDPSALGALLAWAALTAAATWRALAGSAVPRTALLGAS
jgi:hypothetical protein